MQTFPQPKSHVYVRMEKLKQLLATASALLLTASAASSDAAETITYNRDIRPILSDKCFFCHGPDQNQRKGKFRLDVREDAVTKKAIVPGQPDESGVIRRIRTTDPEEVMPPLDSHRTLTAAQKDLLARWIAAGAKYEAHWAYVPPVRPATPPGKNPIDVLVLQRLHELGLEPFPQADRRTLARRLYFDLIGLPPKPEAVEAFARDKSPDAVSQLVEKLLAMPQFGERMAIGWLDVARFADTIGYHSDNPRNVWPYRDYVIKAFNENKPFDQFTREQLAGDLLPNCTQETKVGSAFNRLLLSTEEGGAQPKDYEARMLTDRVRAVGSVWLGQTIGCAQCHDHKFDPFTQRDFYSLGAFFADIKEPIIGGREPGMLVPDDKQAPELSRLEADLAKAQKEYDAPHPEWAAAYADWQKVHLGATLQDRHWTALTPLHAESANGSKLKIEKDHSVLVSGKKSETDTYTVSFTNGVNDVVGLRLEALPHDSLPAKGPGRADNGNFVLTEVTARIQRADQTTNVVSFKSARADVEQAGDGQSGGYATYGAAATIDGDAKGAEPGWAILPAAGQPHQLVLALAAPLTLQPGDRLTLELKQNRAGHLLGHFRIGVTTNAAAVDGNLRFPPAKEIGELLQIAADQRDAAQKEKLFAHFKSVAPEAAAPRDQLAAARKAKSEFEAKLPRCLVSATNDEPRTVRILPRGNFLIETGDVMKPALPAVLAGSASSAGDRKLNRLDLANWLVSGENPLTARVVMNRLWKQFFGMGLSKVVDDLGAQGELPPNQALLDWLACEFMSPTAPDPDSRIAHHASRPPPHAWDMKHMIRLIVNSDAYQRTSVPTEKLRTRDPLNRELAVQSRWRLDAELVRDNALSVSGLLVEKIGGPSVKPYQPDGYWENLNFPVRSYDATVGPDQYRRGLYVWWQRSYLHPSLVAFDAPTREECAADRNRSNIPQQALVLLNDPTYVEASRAFATRVLQEGGGNTKARLTWAWRQVLDRKPRADELKTLEPLLTKHLAEYRTNPSAAEAFLKIGQTPLPSKIDQAELAAWTNIARVILNLHETITRS